MSQMSITPNVRRAVIVVSALIAVVVVFSYIIFPDVICSSARENALHTKPSPDRVNIDPIVETCKGAASVLSH